MKSIKRIAAELGIAEIRIWALIRQNLVSSRANRIGVYVDEAEVRDYYSQCPELLEQLQRAFLSAQQSISKR